MSSSLHPTTALGRGSLHESPTGAFITPSSQMGKLRLGEEKSWKDCLTGRTGLRVLGQFLPDLRHQGPGSEATVITTRLIELPLG